MLLISSATQATKYYVSWSTGNDSNNGLTEGTAWKSIYEIATHTFAKGDSLLFNSGERWVNDGVSTSNDYALTLNVSGGSGMFYVGKYGTGAIPFIDGTKQLPGWQTEGNWELYATGIYRRANFEIGNRMWLNGKEVKEAASLSLTTEFPWRVHTDGYLYVKSTGNPATYYNSMSYSAQRASLIMTNQSDVVIENIKIGGAGSFTMTNCKNVTIQNCELFYRSASNGIYIIANNNDSTKNVVIQNNLFHTGDSLYYTYYRASHTTGDAVWIGNGSVGVKVLNNTFWGWSHGGPVFTHLDCNYKFHDNEIGYNFITAPLIDYARGIASYFCDDGYNNIIHHNSIINTSVQNQLTGNGLKFYDNIIYGTRGCPYPEKAGVGNGIALEPYPVPTTNMEIYNNVINNCEDVGIRLFSQTGDTSPIQNNNFHDNNVWETSATYKYQLHYYTNSNLQDNTFTNNHFVHSTTTNTIVYRGGLYDVAGFNGQNLTNNDTIVGNNAQLTFGARTPATTDVAVLYNDTNESKYVSAGWPGIDASTGEQKTTSFSIPAYSSLVLIKNIPNPAGLKRPFGSGGKMWKTRTGLPIGGE